jgi:5-methylcytosine-specific restriction endonuclease McrA
MSNEEHKEVYGKALHVHHIERKESFRDKNGELDYERANRVENLITLCNKCHGRWEGIPLRPQ